MSITVRSFAEWLDPGPEVMATTGRSFAAPSWTAPIPAGSPKTLFPAIPSVLATPRQDEWKKSLTELEWQLVGPIWVAIGRQILARDPYFKFVKHPAYIDASGKFTKHFKAKEWRPTYVHQLAWRMDEELSYYGQAIEALSSGPAPSLLTAEGIALENLEFADPNQGTVEALWRIPWKKIAEVAVKYSPTAVRAVRMYSIQGIIGSLAYEGVTEVAKWGVAEYKRAERRREKQRQKRASLLGMSWDELESNSRLLTTDREVAELLDTSVVGTASLKGFEVPNGNAYVGTWATPVNKPRGSDYAGFIPPLLLSHDGVYL